jgi:hypothetical protein
MEFLVEWLGRSGVSAFVNEHAWAWSALEIAHYAGMILLVGTIGLLDLRLLGFARRLPVGPLHALVPWGLAGFTVSLVTGVLFVAGNPFARAEYALNGAFRVKLLLIVLAGLNVLVYGASGLARQAGRLGPGEPAPPGARLVAAASLCLWLGVLALGRLLPYVGQAF